MSAARGLHVDFKLLHFAHNDFKLSVQIVTFYFLLIHVGDNSGRVNLFKAFFDLADTSAVLLSPALLNLFHLDLKSFLFRGRVSDLVLQHLVSLFKLGTAVRFFHLLFDSNSDFHCLKTHLVLFNHTSVLT